MNVFSYKQNQELTVPRETSPLVEENCFIKKIPDTHPLPTFSESKEKLPSPLWEGHPDHIYTYWRTWEIAFSNLRQPEKGSGFVSNFIDTAFNGCEFMWDSSFMMMFGKYADRIFKFQETMDNLYAHQHRDGFICREIEENTGNDHFTRHDPSATGPEIMAWCEWEYYLSFANKDRLSKVFPPLMAYHRWMAEHHTWPDGTYFSSGWGCGMDNIPRLQPQYDVHFSHGHMVWVDACMQEILTCKSLIKMAKELNRTEFLKELTEELNHLEHVVNEKLWHEPTGFYYDLWKNGKHNMVRHIGAYWALLAQCATSEQANRMIAYLQDETEFCTDLRIPTLSKSHPQYSPAGGYWLGGVWAPTNYMVLKGLDLYGHCDLSHEIGVEHLQAVVDVCKQSNTLFENYAPEKSDGKFVKGTPAGGNFVGWTGLVPISILFEFVFGIKPDTVNNRICWHVNLLEKHGIERYPFGTDGELTLICHSRNSKMEKPKITAKSNIPLTLEILWGNGKEVQSEILSL